MSATFLLAFSKSSFILMAFSFTSLISCCILFFISSFSLASCRYYSSRAFLLSSISFYLSNSFWILAYSASRCSCSFCYIISFLASAIRYSFSWSCCLRASICFHLASLSCSDKKPYTFRSSSSFSIYFSFISRSLRISISFWLNYSWIFLASCACIASYFSFSF